VFFQGAKLYIARNSSKYLD